ncbi:MAG: hypothetical protein HQL27_06685 [Candidatus Omnitrophica bacterium]|nr:hypothetical protein [Candidatus Omnitrophota bacterium]
MTQQIQELIDKIKQDGIQEADKKAKEIEIKAQENARKIIEEAQKNAKQIIAEAKKEAEQKLKTTQASLAQGSRDMLLSLRKEIEMLLAKLMQKQVAAALSSEDLARILSQVIQGCLGDVKGSREASVFLSAHDLEAVKSSVLGRLPEEFKKGVVFASSDDIARGFVISFDAGKSQFDFTDKSLAEYISGFVNEEVAKIIKG